MGTVVALAGQVGLLSDPGAKGANSVGVALGAGYMLEDNFELEMQYLASNHPEVEHRDLSVGGNYYLGDYENAYPHISFGMSFLTNRFTAAGSVGDAVAIYLGGGLNFELSRNLSLGPEVRYQKAFEAKGEVAGRDIVRVGDSYMILMKLSYALSAE